MRLTGGASLDSGSEWGTSVHLCPLSLPRLLRLLSLLLLLQLRLSLLQLRVSSFLQLCQCSSVSAVKGLKILQGDTITVARVSEVIDDSWEPFTRLKMIRQFTECASYQAAVTNI